MKILKKWMDKADKKLEEKASACACCSSECAPKKSKKK